MWAGILRSTFELAESCILYAIMAGTIKTQRNLACRIKAHKILKNSVLNLESHQFHVILWPFCLWCGSPSHRYFCTTEIGYPVFPRYLIPLAKMLHLMRGVDWLEEIQIGAKLTEI